jgi:hypothetical protein
MVQDPAQVQRQIDCEHLNILKIFHYVFAGIVAAFSCLFVFHIFIGWSIVFNHSFMGLPVEHRPPSEFGWFFIMAGIGAIVCAWSLALLNVYAGRCLSQHKKRPFIFVAAALNCLQMPLGLILGIFTFVVMFRPSVRDLFEETAVPLNAVAAPLAADLNLDGLPDPDEAAWRELEQKARSQQALKAMSESPWAPAAVDKNVPTGKQVEDAQETTSQQEGDREIIRLDEPVFLPEKNRDV